MLALWERLQIKFLFYKLEYQLMKTAFYILLWDNIKKRKAK